MTLAEVYELEHLQKRRGQLTEQENVRRMNLLLQNAEYLIRCAKLVHSAIRLGGGVGRSENKNVDDGVR